MHNYIYRNMTHKAENVDHRESASNQHHSTSHHAFIITYFKRANGCMMCLVLYSINIVFTLCLNLFLRLSTITNISIVFATSTTRHLHAAFFAVLCVNMMFLRYMFYWIRRQTKYKYRFKPFRDERTVLKMNQNVSSCKCPKLTCCMLY